MAMTARIPVIGQASLFDYFHERVEEVTRARRHPVSQDTIYYLSQLLAEQGHREDDEPETLVELRQRAAHGDWAAATDSWRRLGDHALLQLGLFREHLRRRRLSERYVTEMGRGAYGTVARMMRGHDCTLGELFDELAGRWDACTAVLSEVGESGNDGAPADVLRLYEEWLATGSLRAAERLRELGVVPVRGAAHC